MKKILMVLISMTLLLGCSIPMESIDSYKDGIIVEKKNYNYYKESVKLRLKNNSIDSTKKGQYYIKSVRVVEYDYKRYSLGDTIK
jgi:PBP1b-binding outer membrane lipoprotein LpoB